MKKIIFVFLAIGILMTMIIADLTITAISKTNEIDKTQRDYLLSKLPTTLDSKGEPITNEIKPVISIRCNEDLCYYDAVQEGLISSYSNPIERTYCSKFDDKIGNCTEYSTYTTEEIENIAVEKVAKRLLDYANVSMIKDTKPIEKVSEGNLTLTEKR